MSYANRFSFLGSISFKHIFRGIEYIEKIEDFEIEGNVACAKIYGTKPYTVSFGIDFFKRTIMYGKCTCPYAEDHRNCKHIVALMLYTDIYLNGGSIVDMVTNFISSYIVKQLKILNKTKKEVFLSDIEELVINRNLNILASDLIYKIPYLKSLNNISRDQFEKALDILVKKEIVSIEKTKRVWTNINLAKRYKDTYHAFFAKYNLLIGHGDYVCDYWNGNEYYDKNETYFYGKEIKEYKKGIDLNQYASFFVSNKDNEFLFDTKNRSIVYPRIDEDFNVLNCIEFPNLLKSNTLIEFYISTIKDEALKQNIINEYESYRFNVKELATSEKTKFHKIESNFVIGLAAKYCLEEKIPFYFGEQNF